MSASDLISVVIPCYNPKALVEETIAGVRRQTHAEWEIVVVDDGSDDPESLGILENIEQRKSPRVTVVHHQENRGPAAARNTGFRHSRGRYVVPLDSDDLLAPTMIEVCLAEMETRPEAGFAYFDYRVFGDRNYIEYPGEYSLYRLLNENFMAHCIFVRREAWEEVGGYDEWLRWSYEDWDFSLHLGEQGWYGHYIPQTLFAYRTHGRGHHYRGLERHESNWAHMCEMRPALLSPEGRLRVKREWAPSICFVVDVAAAPSFENQTVRDYQVLLNVDEKTALEKSKADCFLWMRGDRPLLPQAAEECIWALQTADWVTWTDTGDAPPPSVRECAGPLGLSRDAVAREEPKESGEVRRLPWACRDLAPAPASTGGKARKPVPPDPSGIDPSRAGSKDPPREPQPGIAPLLDLLLHHLQNAEVLSWEAWLEHPLRSATRLIPLRFKERVNDIAGRPVFDLSFYLQFQPKSVLIDGGLIERLDYIPPQPRADRRRLALFIPHLGFGGAENVLLEFASRLDRQRYEVFLIATQSDDSRLRPDWDKYVDHVWDAAQLAPAEQSRRFLYTMALNWAFDVLVIQNSSAAYSVLPAIKKKRSGVVAIDILHNVDQDWDFFSATLEVAEHLDRRVVISQAGRQRLIDMATPPEKIRLIRNGVDLARFDSGRYQRGRLQRRLNVPERTKVVLFAGALVRRKRPRLVVDVAMELERLRPAGDYHFVVAGDGPEEERLRRLLDTRGLAQRVSLVGHIDDMGQTLADASLLLITSREEGIPLVLVEALAMQTPVVSSRAGAIEEALPPSCGVLVEPGEGEEHRLALAIHQLLDDDARRIGMGRAGRARVERDYSLERARKQYRELMAELEALTGA